MNIDDLKIGVVGLGYVGLPLCLEFGKKFKTVGYDNNQKRINELNAGVDSTNEVSREDFEASTLARFSLERESLVECNFYIVTVPTPIDDDNKPDLRHLEAASQTVADVMSLGDYIVYESTVFPGATEEICVPILEKGSGLKLNEGFFVGYSPERINPGDKNHRLVDIVKVTSGSSPEAAECVNEVYSSVISAGTFKAESIKVAEAAKVIENTQRDLNIALINELSMIFEKLDLDTHSVLEAAGTKWNFLNFKPGLVGGHCIGVDPYYLTDKAEKVGHKPEVILAGRRINDGMASYVVDRIINLLSLKGESIKGCRVLMLGLAFKPDCPDIRNTKVIDVYRGLVEKGAQVDVFDPRVSAEEVNKEYGVDLVHSPEGRKYDVVVLAVGHKEFANFRDTEIGLSKPLICFDIPGIWPVDEVDGRL